MNREKKKVLIYGMYGAKNVGDELVGLSMIKNTQLIFDQSEITLISMDSEYTKTFLGIKGVDILEIKVLNKSFILKATKIFKAIKETDVVLVGGGGLFQDQYSFHLPASSILIALIGLMYEKKVFIVGTGFGPLRRKWITNVIRDSFGYLDGIFLRDSLGVQTIKNNIGHLKTIKKTGDVVPALDEIGKYNKRNMIKINNNSNKIGFILREWKGIDEEKIAKLINELVNDGYDIQFYCFEFEADINLVNRIIDKFSGVDKDKIEIIQNKTIEDIVTNMLKCKLIISMRLHGCILASYCKIPWIPIEYEIKVRSFAEQMGVTEIIKTTYELGPSIKKELLDWCKYYEDNIEKMSERFNEISENSKKSFEFIKQNKEKIDVNKNKIIILIIKIFLFSFIENLLILKNNFLRKSDVVEKKAQ